MSGDKRTTSLIFNNLHFFKAYKDKTWQELLPKKLADSWIRVTGPQSLRGHVRSNNELKTLHLLFHLSYCHQTFKDQDFL